LSFEATSIPSAAIETLSYIPLILDILDVEIDFYCKTIANFRNYCMEAGRKGKSQQMKKNLDMLVVSEME
jgi:hypothetical protein